MIRHAFTIVAVIVTFLMSCLYLPVHSQAAPVLSYVIEDGSNASPSSYYGENPSQFPGGVCDRSSTQVACDSTYSLHFITTTAYGSGYLTKFALPTPQDFTEIAKNGAITFYLWVNTPANAAPYFQFIIGNNSSNVALVYWNIGTGLLVGGQWNKVVIRLQNGLSTLSGSTVNGIALSSDTNSSIPAPYGNMDWANINYHRLGFWTPSAPIEGYIDAMVATSYVIEDALYHNPPASWYDEDPAAYGGTFNVSTTAPAPYNQALYFQTNANPSHGDCYFTKYLWPQTLNLSDVGDNGYYSFDLWISDNTQLYDLYSNHNFNAAIGSRNAPNYTGDGFVVWNVDSSLLAANAWNHVKLRIRNGAASLTGSTVNGTAIGINGNSSVENNGVMDWTRINYHKVGLCVNAQLSGYLTNIMVSTVDPSAIPNNTLNLSTTDANPRTPYNWPNVLDSQNYNDIIPPDVMPSSFFTDDILHPDTTTAWQATFYNYSLSGERFCRSNDQALRGVPNIKIDAISTGDDHAIIMKPTTPITINQSFDTVDVWLYGHYEYGTKFAISFTYKGKRFNWTGGDMGYTPPGQLFCSWMLAHIVLPQEIPAGAQLTLMEIDPPAGTGAYLYYIDQLRVYNSQTYLANTPRPTYPDIGSLVTLPVEPTGACPTTVDIATTTSTTLIGNVGTLSYTSGGITLTYKYTPKRITGSGGTLTDLVETRSDRTTGTTKLVPAEGSGPVFTLNGVTYNSTTGGCSTTLMSYSTGTSGIDGALCLKYLWRYNTPSSTNITYIMYKLSLKKKTLRIEAYETLSNGITPATTPRAYCWLFGHANATLANGSAGTLVNGKVLQLPFMLASPNVLCNDGMFTTYYADWYLSNVSQIPESEQNSTTTNLAYYSYPDWKYLYKPMTDGILHYPLKECFYITTSSVLDDCLLNISNPPSPNKTTLKKNTYRMIGPGPNWIAAAQSTADLYSRYGMTNMYYIFHAGMFSYRGGRGNEPWHSRLSASVSAPGGTVAVQNLFAYMWNKGITPGYYSGYYWSQPISKTWDYNNTALSPDKNWEPTWVQAVHMKPWNFPQLAKTFTEQQQVPIFNPGVIYEDGWTTGFIHSTNDYDQRMIGNSPYPDSNYGTLIDTIRALATGYRNERNAVNGPIFSEGNGADFYTAGLNDGDYGKLAGFANGQTPDVKRQPLLVDFELKKVAPLHTPVGIDICYFMYAATNLYCSDGFKYLYEYLANEIAFGTIGSVEPYSLQYADTTYFDKTMTSYFMMQQLQNLYIMETISNVQYFDGTALRDTSYAVMNNVYLRNMVKISYGNGLVIYINCNWDNLEWPITSPVDGLTYILPRGGWYAYKDTSFVEYSALVNGNRVDYVNGSDYVYVDGHGQQVTLGGITTNSQAVGNKATNKAIEYPVLSGSADKCIIEDGIIHNPPASYYDEQTPTLNYSTVQVAPGSTQSMHFITGAGSDQAYITKYQWPWSKDVSEIVSNCALNMYLWIDHPENLSTNGQFLIQLGSKSNEAFTQWFVNGSLLTANAWNNISLKIVNGQAIYIGSTVNGNHLTASNSNIINGNVDWTMLNYHKFGFWSLGTTVEGYIDAVVLQSSSLLPVIINQASSQIDPTKDSPINFTVEFGAAVTGFTSSDVSLSGTAFPTTAVVTGSGSLYNVAISGMTKSGKVIASINQNTVTDLAGHSNAASISTDNVVTFVVPQTVLVGNLGNVADTTGFGSVDYAYNIGKYEVTVSQYTEFLNAKAQSDPYGLYITSMATISGTYTSGCNIVRSGSSGSYVYTIGTGSLADFTNWGNRPVNYVSFWDACRYANWLHNGKGNGDTETGAYTMTADGITYNTITRNAGAKWAVANENEWYKAAYYDPDKAIGAGYWLYSDRYDTVPGREMVDITGQNANYKTTTYIDTTYYRTNVGEFELSDSFYGTFDQGGNVWEWIESIINSTHRILRGGSYYVASSYLSNVSSTHTAPTTERFDYGFRVVNLEQFFVTLTGTINLLDYDGDKTAVSVTVELNGIPYNLNLDIDGKFIITNLADETYDVRIKASHWLAKMTPSVVVTENTVMDPVTLINGDVVDNNEVDFSDINAVRAAYGSFPGDETWNERADVNGSGEVDFTDINLVRSNYGEIGD